MSKKKSSKGKIKKEMRKQEEIKKQRSPFAKFYDKMFPPKDGVYTLENNKKHHRIMLSIVAVIVIIIGICVFLLSSNAKEIDENTLTLPKIYFTSGQNENAIKALEEQGFTNITYDEEQGITAHGSKEMVQTYKNSYKEKFLDKALETASKDWSETELGISSIEVSDDCSEVTIYTFTNEVNSQIFNTFLDDDELYDALRYIAIWNGMNNTRQEVHYIFKYVMDGEQYYEAYAKTTDDIVSQIEAEETQKAMDAANENKAANAEGSNNSEEEQVDGQDNIQNDKTEEQNLGESEEQ